MTTTDDNDNDDDEGYVELFMYVERYQTGKKENTVFDRLFRKCEGTLSSWLWGIRRRDSNRESNWNET